MSEYDLEARLGVDDLDPARTDPDGIDDYMQRGRWFVWDPEGDGKPPIDPTDPDAGPVSFNDLDRAADFETAVATAAERGFGLSYPLRNRDPANPADPTAIRAIDIDITDAVGDKTGAGWVPDLNRLGDASAEYSPSGNLRVYLRDVEIPEWWTDLATGDRERPEIGLYDGEKHVTVTGDTVDGLEPPVGTCNQPAFEQWLKEAWYGFHDEVLEADYTVGEGEPWVDDDDRTVAGGPAGTGTFDFDDVKVTDLSFVTVDAGGRGAHPVHGSSNGNNFIVDDDDLTWRCWRAGHECTGNALQLLAVEEGIVGCGEWHALGDDEWHATFEAARERGLIPDDADTRAPTSGTDGADDGDAPAGSVPTGSIVERDGGYARWLGYDDDGNAKYEQLTNFTIDAQNLLTHADGTREYHLRVIPEPGVSDEPYEVAVEPTVFNDPRAFKTDVVTGFGVWSDCGYGDLNEIRERLARQDAPRRNGTVSIGFHDGELVVPDGALTADGWSDDPATVFTGDIQCGWTIEPGDGYDPDDVAAILELLPQTRASTLDRFLPALGWFYTAPLSPIVREWEGEFNILNVLGDTGSGKTATLETLERMFGFDGDLAGANGTPFPKLRRMAATTLPLVFDEYKPAEMSDYRQGQFHDHLRTSTRGGVTERGHGDQTVTRYHLRAPVCVAGEQPIQGPAEERRSVLTSFTQDDVKDAPGPTRAFAELCGSVAADGGDAGDEGRAYDGYDLSQHAVAYYQWLLGRDRDELREGWVDAYETIAPRLTEWGFAGLDDIVVQGYVTVLFGCRLYRQFAREFGVDAEAVGVTDEAAIDAIRYLTLEGTGAEHHSHLDRLIGLMDRAIADGALEPDTHYATVDPRDGDPLVVFKMDRAFDKVRKYAREHDVSGEDLLDSYGDYSGRIRDAVDDDASPLADTSKQARGFGRGVAIERAAFDALTEPPAMGDESAEAGAGGDGDEPTAEGTTPPFDALTGGYQTLVGTVATVMDPPPWLEAEGTLVDGDGRPVTYHVKSPRDGGAPADLHLDEGTTYRIENARVTTDRDGERVVELIPGTTTVGALREPGGGEQAGLADGGDGAESQHARITAILEEVRAASTNGDGVTLGELAGRLGYDPTTLSGDLDKLTREGRIDEGDEGRYTR